VPSTELAPVPGFVGGSRLLTAAHDVAAAVHGGPLGTGRTSLRHPVAVAGLLHEAGYPTHVLAAALLHDVVEDGSIDLWRLEERFGPRVARLVDQLTEDATIPSFARRKATLRERAVGSGYEAAAIFAADKLATVRALLERGESPPPEKLEHYRRSLWVLQARHPELPFLPELAADLQRLVAAGRR
jgi:(p)ppGpp synthase/HD superfamily hydrolase